MKKLIRKNNQIKPDDFQIQKSIPKKFFLDNYDPFRF